MTNPMRAFMDVVDKHVVADVISDDSEQARLEARNRDLEFSNVRLRNQVLEMENAELLSKLASNEQAALLKDACIAALEERICALEARPAARAYDDSLITGRLASLEAREIQQDIGDYDIEIVRDGSNRPVAVRGNGKTIELHRGGDDRIHLLRVKGS